MLLNCSSSFLHTSIGEVYRNKRPEYVAKLLTPSGATTNKGNTMANRFRVEIYDANKLNDITIYSDQGVDKEYLTELVFSNIKNFSGKINAYVFDNVNKKKTTAMFLDESTVEFNKNLISKAKRIEFGN